jgi:hypothetical protein
MNVTKCDGCGAMPARVVGCFSEKIPRLRDTWTDKDLCPTCTKRMAAFLQKIQKEN